MKRLHKNKKVIILTKDERGLIEESDGVVVSSSRFSFSVKDNADRTWSFQVKTGMVFCQYKGQPSAVDEVTVIPNPD